MGSVSLGAGKAAPPAGFTVVLVGRSQIAAVREAVTRYCISLFFDADTYVCRSLQQLVKPLWQPQTPYDVGFTRASKVHPTANNCSRLFAPFDEATPEANTGVLALRRTPSRVTAAGLAAPTRGRRDAAR